MAGFNIPDASTPVTDIGSKPVKTVQATPGAGVTSILLVANYNCSILVNVLRVASTLSIDGADTYTVYRVATGGVASALNAIATKMPLEDGEINFHENVALAAGDEIRVKSVGGNVTFTADYSDAL